MIPCSAFSHMLDTFKYGAQNNIPITLALPQLGFLQITPGVSFQNRILSTKYDYNWNHDLQKLDTSSTKRHLFCQFRRIFAGLEHSPIWNIPEFRKKQQGPGHPAYGQTDHQFFLFAGSFKKLL